MFRRDEGSLPPSSRLFSTGWFSEDESRAMRLVELGVGEFFRYQSQAEFKKNELEDVARELYGQLGLGRPYIVTVPSPNAFCRELTEYFKMRSFVSLDYPTERRMMYFDSREASTRFYKEMDKAMNFVLDKNISNRTAEMLNRALSEIYRLTITPTFATSLTGELSDLFRIGETYALLAKILATFIVSGRESSQWYYYRVEPLIRLLLGSFFFVPLVEICFIIQKPTFFRFEGQGMNIRLHNDKGPLLTFADNQKLYMYKNIRVADYVIEAPEKITVAEILDERNVEQRRIKLERYGFARFMLDAGAKVVDEYKGEVAGLKGAKLYEILLGELEAGNAAETLKMVSVVDSTPENGEYRTYFLRVPPNMRTAEEAVAWTWGMEPGQYLPIKEA